MAVKNGSANGAANRIADVEVPPDVGKRAAPPPLTIPAPKFRTATFKLVGTAPYMQARFAQKAMNAMAEKMRAGSTAAKGKTRSARDFNDDFLQAQHISEDGWVGIPASAFRKAMISACRIVNFKMTLAKLSLFVERDGLDKVDGTPLVKLDAPPPEMSVMPVRNATGVMDLRARPQWRKWGVTIRVRYDADQFLLADVTNLVNRVGCQVGIGEGRPDSRESAGMDMGTFEIESVAG